MICPEKGRGVGTKTFVSLICSMTQWALVGQGLALCTDEHGSWGIYDAPDGLPEQRRLLCLLHRADHAGARGSNRFAYCELHGVLLTLSFGILRAYAWEPRPLTATFTLRQWHGEVQVLGAEVVLIAPEHVRVVPRTFLDGLRAVWAAALSSSTSVPKSARGGDQLPHDCHGLLQGQLNFRRDDRVAPPGALLCDRSDRTHRSCVLGDWLMTLTPTAFCTRRLDALRLRRSSSLSTGTAAAAGTDLEHPFLRARGSLVGVALLQGTPSLFELDPQQNWVDSTRGWWCGIADRGESATASMLRAGGTGKRPPPIRWLDSSLPGWMWALGPRPAATGQLRFQCVLRRARGWPWPELALDGQQADWVAQAVADTTRLPHCLVAFACSYCFAMANKQ